MWGVDQGQGWGAWAWAWGYLSRTCEVCRQQELAWTGQGGHAHHLPPLLCFQPCVFVPCCAAAGGASGHL